MAHNQSDNMMTTKPGPGSRAVQERPSSRSRAPNPGASLPIDTKPVRCAIYTRKSTEEGLSQEFNSLDAQREAGENFVASQRAEGWICLPDRYDDGGYTGGNLERPGVQRLMADIEAGHIDCVVVYKVDRLSRSILDFARMMEKFDRHQVTFVSVTQHFNTAQSMGRLTLNVLLSFAQFEREIISERTRDKIAAARRKGKWSGGMPVLGYDVDPQGSKLRVNDAEAQRVRAIFDLYLAKGSLLETARELNRRGWPAKQWTTRQGNTRGGRPFDKSTLRQLLTNVAYVGQVRYKREVHPGEHAAIVSTEVWQRVQQMLTSNGLAGGMYVRNKYGALLKGLLRCQPCGLAMGHTYTVRNGNRCYRYYTCYGAQRRGHDTCPSGSLPAEQIEQFVVERIRAIGTDPDLRSSTLAAAEAQCARVIEPIQDELEQIKHEAQRILSAIRAATRTTGNVDELTRLQGELAEVQGRERSAQQRLAEAEAGRVNKAELDAALGSFDPVWSTLTPREQARALRLLVERVDYDGQNQSVSITFRPNGLRSLEVAAPMVADEPFYSTD